MKDWIIMVVDYILSNWQTVLIGGACAVSVVVFILGCIKPLIKRWIPNTTVCKVIFAWLSVILNIPATAMSLWVEGLPTEHFWTLMVINAIGTILVYFVYENTALRNAMHWLGKKIITILFSQYVSPAQTKKEVRNEVENLLANPSVAGTATTPTPSATVKSRYNNNIKL